MQDMQDGPRLFGAWPLDLLILMESDPAVAAAVGDGRLCEIAFEHGDPYEAESFGRLMGDIFGWNLVIFANLYGAHALGEVPDEHLRPFAERRERRFMTALGFARTAPHDLIRQWFAHCVTIPFDASSGVQPGGDIEKRMMQFFAAPSR